MHILDRVSFIIQQFDKTATDLSRNSSHQEPCGAVRVWGLAFFSEKKSLHIYSFDTNPDSWYLQEYLGNTKNTFKSYFILCLHAYNLQLT